MREYVFELPLSEDQADLYAWAERTGWLVDRIPHGPGAAERLVLTRPGSSVEVLFSHDGAFRFARAAGPGSPGVELDLPATLDVLERSGAQGAAPTGPTGTPGPQPTGTTPTVTEPAGAPPRLGRPAADRDRVPRRPRPAGDG
ncbi:hypothetical protein [Kitasatospora sp. NPDC088346]|uniref:hypothetical protein n=1 Tax=Kitasatospora sp. NPDC088346 TaxID=3364073 RepID=UPI0038056037